MRHYFVGIKVKNANVKINAPNFLFTLNAPSKRARLITDKKKVFTCRNTGRSTASQHTVWE